MVTIVCWLTSLTTLCGLVKVMTFSVALDTEVFICCSPGHVLYSNLQTGMLVKDGLWKLMRAAHTQYKAEACH